MKKLFIATFVVAALIGAAYPSFAQQLTKQDYLEKSKKQKTTAFILLGGGAALLGAGAIIGSENFCLFSCTDSQNNAMNAASVMVVAGGAAMIASIPVFVSSGKNARKAAELSLNYQPMNAPRFTGAIPKAYPALTLTIPID
ncbi:hypothetical protein E4S40_11980 [Algoriphagus kandeliae]|uniref:DUF4134 domain-containing protein n=1 Tax=Algoriphagus kandeliae TaxID=2562278 RepID=A0A4Y9QQ06_9BACT|nr:hypothetical protein [Algoriphagus kandeliae]TFV94721.1 hypothetical protein E4S40_11980 [Algoriphagus kandeliae]